ncbi:hypothetical protein [Streptomyces sp. NPDC057280]|uniref:hypothetical protein n=1 Tax=Streptomyces sp. NPDC057280 TaxID=3346081 RepID=UPI003642E845
MTHDFGGHFTKELGKRFGSHTDSWPTSAEQVPPFFTIVVNTLGTDDAARWFEAACKAHQSVETAERDRTPPLPHHVETEAHHEIPHRDSSVDVDVDVFFGCALRACSRGSGRAGRAPLAAGANA